MRAVAKLAFAVIVGTGAALYSSESPAPPPPILNCTSGAPAALVFESPSTALGGSINSAMGGSVLVQAVDASGNPLRDVPITFTAPATGPSAGFALFTDASHYTLSPQVTVNTRSDCHGIGPPAIANGLVGGYQIAASTSSVAQPLLIAATNTAPATPSELVAQDFSTQRIAHVGAAFPALQLAVRDASGFAIAGVPITIKLPGSGPGATFPGGATSATVYSDAFGREVAPTLTSNSEVGAFQVELSAPGLGPIEAGPFINAGATQILMDGFGASEPSGGLPDIFFVFYGQTIPLRVWVIFPGLPLPPEPSSFPRPNGTVSLRVDGNVVATAALDQFYYTHVCVDCPGPTLIFDFRLNDPHIGFGKHQVTATYEADTAYDSSTSVPNELRMFSQFPLATPFGQSLLGTTGGRPYSWDCRLENPAWRPIDQIGATQAAPFFLYGLLSYRIDQCAYHGGYFDAPPPVFQILALQMPVPLSPGTTFVNYGPTADNPSPHFYAIPAEIDGATIRVSLADGNAGDDDMLRNGIISGLGGPALPTTPVSTVTVVEFYAASLDHYFISADAQEIAALDNQVIPGWTRTGFGFKAYPAGTSATSAVCRFYIPPESGDSHFFSASPTECAQTRQKFPTLVYESPDVFHVGLPDPATGNCAVGTIPVYRVWNDRYDSNHRYTTSRTLRDQMLARGYLAEGYGADVVVMCAAQ